MIYYYWISGYVLAGFIFTILVEWANDFAIKYGYTEDVSHLNNGDRWIISLLWPIGVIVAIKGLIQNYFK